MAARCKEQPHRAIAQTSVDKRLGVHLILFVPVAIHYMGAEEEGMQIPKFKHASRPCWNTDIVAEGAREKETAAWLSGPNLLY